MASISSTTITSRWIQPKLQKQSNSISLKTPNRKSFLNSTICTPNIPTTIKFPKQNPSTPQWNLLQKAAAIALDALERAVTSRERQTPYPKTSDPRVQIAGNFAPVPEQPVHYSLPVTGKIPKSIAGVYIRNGPNPHFEPTAGHHFFDGDGMIHAVQFKEGAASYTCRFTQTERLIQEKTLGRPVFPKAIGEFHGHSGIVRLLLFYARALFGLVDHSHGIGVANAGLVYFNNRILAMSEDDLPYQIKITGTGELKTIVRYSKFNSKHNYGK